MSVFGAAGVLLALQAAGSVLAELGPLQDVLEVTKCSNKLSGAVCFSWNSLSRALTPDWVLIWFSGVRLRRHQRSLSLSLGSSCVGATEGSKRSGTPTVSPEHNISLLPLKNEQGSGDDVPWFWEKRCVLCHEAKTTRPTGKLDLVPREGAGTCDPPERLTRKCSGSGQRLLECSPVKLGFCLRKWCGWSAGKCRVSTLYVSYMKWQFSSVTCEWSFPWCATGCQRIWYKFCIAPEAIKTSH